ncbi:hypothetical protein Tco_1342959, partial [Tanacetum coccineum]
VPVTTITEPPLLSTTTLPPPTTPLITHLQQTPIPTPATASSSSLQDLPNFGSLFRLRDEAQVENANFINKLDDNIKKIIKDQVKEQVKAQVSKILLKIKKTINEQLEAESADESAQADKPMQTAKDLEEPAHLEFKRGVTKDQLDEEPLSFLMEDPHKSFNELMDTPLDFSAFVMNRLKVETLTPELLVGPTFELMKGSCKSLVELEYLFEEVYKVTINQLDWNNPKSQPYSHDLRKLLPLIPNS